MKLFCPSCGGACEAQAVACARCNASFEGEGSWKPTNSNAAATRIEPIGFGELIWRLIKLLLSLVLVAMAVNAVINEHARAEPLRLLGAIAFLLVLVSLLWMPWHRPVPARLVPVICFLAAAGLGFATFKISVGDISFPLECSGRRRWFCDLLNVLFAVGGNYAAGILFALLTGLALVATVRSTKNVMRDSRIGKANVA